MKITIACIGKLNETYLRDAFAEYAKFLSHRCVFSVIEIPDIAAPASFGDAETEAVRKSESEALYAKIGPGSHIIALDQHGKSRTSDEFSDLLKNFIANNINDVTFTIGGSLGIHPGALKRSDERLSLSEMTFPHQWARVILAEQLCRAWGAGR